MAFYALMRCAAQLRRIAKAIERRNELEEERSRAMKPRPTRHTEFSVAKVEDWNENYDEKQRTGGLT